MFDYFKGELVNKRKTSKGAFVTIEVAGVGYLLEVTENDFINSEIDISQKYYVLLIHREDSMSLYGFLSRETRDIFQILLSVSGVGAKMALALLNEFDVCDLISFVVNENFKELTRAKGIGVKLAQKIILELKDKLIKTDLPQSTSKGTINNQSISDVQNILLSLGYENKEIETSLNSIMNTISDETNSEEILRKALVNLSY